MKRQILDSLNASRETSSAADARLTEILEDYLEQLEKGQIPDREQILSANPELAESLAEDLQKLDMLHRAAQGLDGVSGNRTLDSLALRPDVESTSLGDFRLIREIGRGGMGVVYEANQISLDRRVALKVLPFATLLNKHQLNRFKNEARAAATLDHPHIVSIHAIGEERGVHYYAMQLIDGPSLAQVYEAMRQTSDVDDPTKGDEQVRSQDVGVNPALDTIPIAHFAESTNTRADYRDYCRRIARLGFQAASALAHAHDNGILHRDVKPANLLLDRDGNLLVADFGLAQTQFDTELTVTGDVLGTLRYMSPEQARGNNAILDCRTDIYSLGVSLYEMLTLSPAIKGQDRADLLRGVTESEPIAPRKLQAAIPNDLEKVILKSMAKNAEGRYASMSDFAQDLQRFVDGESVRARRPSSLYRLSTWTQRHSSIVTTILAASLLLSAGLVVTWQRETKLRRVAEERSLEAEVNFDVALDVVGEIVDPTANQLKYFLDPEFGNDQIISKTITQLEMLAKRKKDRRIDRSLANLHRLHARNRYRLGLDSMKSAQAAVELALRLFAASPGDAQTARLLRDNYDMLALAESIRGRWEDACNAEAESLRYCKLGNPTAAMMAWNHGHYSVGLLQTRRIRDAGFHSQKSIESTRQSEAEKGLRARSLSVREIRLRTLIEMGEWEQADQLAVETLQILELLPKGHLHEQAFRKYWKAQAYLAIATLRNGQRSADEAIEMTQKAIQIHEEQQEARRNVIWFSRGLAECHLQQSDALAMKQDWAGCEEEIRKAIGLLESHGLDYDLDEAAKARFRLALLLHRTGHEIKARHELQAARERMSHNVNRMPSESFHLRRLLMALTVSSLPDLQDDELALELFDQFSDQDRGSRARYLAVAYSLAGNHQTAVDCIQSTTQGTHSWPTVDGIDQLIASIVLSRAGAVNEARRQLNLAKAAIERRQPARFSDSGPLIFDFFLQASTAPQTPEHSQTHQPDSPDT